MAYLRATGVFFVMMGFFVLGAPLQWLILRVSLPLGDLLPLLFNRCLLGCLKIRVAVHGSASAETADIPQLLVSNHVSWTDIPALGTVHKVAFLAKREVSRWPIIATFAKLQGTIFVDRESRRSIKSANAEMAQRMLEGAWVALFPEGTTHDGSRIGRFRSSHFAAARDLLEGAAHVKAVRIQPIAIRYSSAHAAWLGDDLLLPHVMALVKGAPVTCEIFFCEPLLFDRAADRKQAALECTQRIEKRLEAEASEGATTDHPPAMSDALLSLEEPR